MKKINIYSMGKIEQIFFLVLAVVVLFSSCEDEDKNNLDIFQKTGAFVRFSEAFPSVVDVQSLSDVASISINTTLEDTNNSVTSYRMEVSATIAGASFGPAALGSEITSFPATMTITMSDIASALGLDTADVGFGDTFDFTGTAVSKDGVVYTSERMTFDSETKTVTGGNNTNDIIDEDGYRNAFEFGFAIPCPPEVGNFAGNWTFEMQDLYGDGWDGAFVTVDIDGATTQYTVLGGSGQTHVVNIPQGTQKLVISYTTGAFEEEHVYTVEKPDGTVLGPFGPNPPLCIN